MIKIQANTEEKVRQLACYFYSGIINNKALGEEDRESVFFLTIPGNIHNQSIAIEDIDLKNELKDYVRDGYIEINNDTPMFVLEYVTEDLNELEVINDNFDITINWTEHKNFTLDTVLA